MKKIQIKKSDRQVNKVQDILTERKLMKIMENRKWKITYNCRESNPRITERKEMYIQRFQKKLYSQRNNKTIQKIATKI